MRLRTADKRQGILDAAIQVFREVGYERASMAAISARVGGSKATLYGYFRSKEELFAEAMLTVMDDQAKDVIRLLDPAARDLPSVLREFGMAYLELLGSPDALAIIRVAIAEGANSDLGARLYQKGVEHSWHDTAAFLERLIEQGRLRDCDPHVAAAHLKGLLEAGIMEPLLFGALPWFDKRDAARRAVDVFLAGYGT